MAVGVGFGVGTGAGALTTGVGLIGFSGRTGGGPVWALTVGHGAGWQGTQGAGEFTSLDSAGVGVRRPAVAGIWQLWQV